MGKRTHAPRRPASGARRAVQEKADLASGESERVSASPHGPDLARAQQLVMELMAIEGPSGEEDAVADYVRRTLIAGGADPAAIVTDSANQRTPIPGQTGNLIFKLPGKHRQPRRLFSAHLDTVPICVGCQPVIEGDRVRSAIPTTGLGADDRAGVAVVLTTALEMLQRGGAHPPLTFCWFIQEEIGLQGARLVNKGLLGRPKLAFNWDGGAPDKLTIGATGGYRLEITIRGIASHAGGAPEQGVSAITIAGLAIAQLQQDGWLGLIQRRNKSGTSNLGAITGGHATNVVTDHVRILGEARSHDPEFRQRIVREIERAFRKAAKEVRNTAGQAGEVEIHGRLDYESFKLDPQSPPVLEAQRAVAQCGLDPALAIANGGVDANWLNRHGIPTVTLGCGQLNPHMVTEQLDLPRFRDACRIACALAEAS